MIITLIVISSLLSLIHYLGLESFLYLAIGLPLHVYIGVLISLVLVKLGIAFYKVIPTLRKVVNSIVSVSTRVDTLTQRIDKISKESPFKGGSKRSFSTSMVTYRPHKGRRMPVNGEILGLNKIPENNRFSIDDRLSAVRMKKSDVNAMTIVKDGAWWVKVVVRLLEPIGLTVTGPRVHAIVIIFRKISRIGSTQGIKGLVIYLKACSVCLIQALAGHRLHGESLTKGLGCRISRTNRGIPRFILRNDRLRIRNDEFAMIRFYQTIFNIFRVLDYYGNLKTKTITDPFKGKYQECLVLFQYIPPFIAALDLPKVFPRLNVTKEYGIFAHLVDDARGPHAMTKLRGFYQKGVFAMDWITKSAPGTKFDTALQVSTNPILMIRSAQALARDPKIFKAFGAFTELLHLNDPYRKAFDACLQVPQGFIKSLWTLGKLSIKEEAAGKVRVFAMVTAWVQGILKPLHLLIFDILKSIRYNDGTFNQLGPLKHHLSRAKVAYSLDLSAATDRLPIWLQVEILAELLGSRQLAESWAILLTGITYSLNSLKYGVNTVLQYSIGQPMGALSSWGMLALTHHFIVQASAWHAGVVPVGVWFKDYVVLGDDIVIFDTQVKDQYLVFMKALGMEFGLHKSVLSRKGLALEFAKRMFYKGVDVSPVPILEFTSSLTGIGQFKEFGAKYKLSPVQMAKCLGFRFKALAKLNSGNFSKINYKLKLLLIAQCVPTTTSQADALMSYGAPKVVNVRNSIEELVLTFQRYELARIVRTIESHLETLRNDVSIYWNFGDLYKRFATAPPQRSRKDDREVWTNHWAGTVGRSFLTSDSPLSVDKVKFDTVVEKPLRRALAALVELFVIPAKGLMMEEARKVLSTVNNKNVTRETMAEQIVHFLEVARESALIRPTIVRLERTASLPFKSDPISVRLWKRWAPLLQGAVGLDSLKAKFGNYSLTMINPKRKVVRESGKAGKAPIR